MVAGIITGCSALVLCLVALGIYAFWQKRRAEQAIGLSRPFGKSNVIAVASSEKQCTLSDQVSLEKTKEEKSKLVKIAILVKNPNFTCYIEN